MKSQTFIIAAAVAGAFSSAGAAENPFGATELSQGYQIAQIKEIKQLFKMTGGKCGEAQCASRKGDSKAKSGHSANKAMQNNAVNNAQPTNNAQPINNVPTNNVPGRQSQLSAPAVATGDYPFPQR